MAIYNRAEGGIDKIFNQNILVFIAFGFEELKGEITDFLNQLNTHPAFVLPISAIHGDHVSKRSEKIPWFDGPTVLEALDTFEELKVEEKPLRFPIQDIYQIIGERVLVGKLEAGRLTKGKACFS